MGSEYGSGADYYEYLRQFNAYNRRALHAVLALLPTEPRSFLDIGCGTGALVEMMSKLFPYEALGVDLHHTSPVVRPGDLRHGFNLGRRFDLVTCWEVAEHVEARYANRACRIVAAHVGQWLVFTAAHPDQGGRGHVNEQPPEYWRDKLVGEGLFYDEEFTERLRTYWALVTGPCSWLPQNVQVFERPSVEIVEEVQL